MGTKEENIQIATNPLEIAKEVHQLRTENASLKAKLVDLKAYWERSVLPDYREIMDESADDMNAVERLRFFCSLAMNGQNWLDVEPFFEAIVEERDKLYKSAKALSNLRELLGYSQNGSDQPISISQDDATGSLVMRVNELRAYHGSSLEALIARAIEGEHDG